tara:strand:- start:454 stop:669 length:216 start_codon:yes stop_codon:yes gene_type:complete
MAKTKKTTQKNGDNSPKIDIDKLFEKVSKLGQDLERIEVDIKDMAVELIKVSKEHEERKGIFDRIKNRMGL